MKKLFVKIAFVVTGMIELASAQQDPQFTQFMYNKLIYNPGYAGTSGAVCGVLQYRNQWMGFEGAPTSFVLSADMRLKTLPLGVGINFMTDKVGGMNTSYMRVAGSYNKKIGAGTFGAGLDVGILQKSISSDWIVPEPDKIDRKIPGSYGTNSSGTGPIATNPDLNKVTYDLGLGLFYQLPGKYYVGISATHLTSQLITEGDLTYKVKAHYYLMGGYTFQLNKWSKLTPNLMYKNDLSSSSLDANLTYLWSDMVWVGATYRVDDAAAILAGFQGQTGVGNSIGYKIGFSYDFASSEIKTYTGGSIEFLAGVCYTPKVKKTTTYGNDRFLD